LRERRPFRLPAGRSWPRWWLIGSIAVHFVVLTALVESSMSWNGPWARRGGEPVPGASEPGEQPRQIVLYLPNAPAAPRPGPGNGAERSAPAPAGPQLMPALPPADTGFPVLRPGAGGRDTTALAARGTGTGSRRGARGIEDYTPQLGDGRPWVEPQTGGQIASRPMHLDAAVAMRMRELADSMEKHPLPDANANPYVSRPWTFKVGGKTYGIDSRGLHLGDITIPTAVLAFLSLPQGNIDQARANQAYMAMRADILRAAARAQTEEDFREAVRELRDRKEKEHQEQQQQQGQPQPAQP
jgi:hypothetical protein